ncbi:DHA2 family efflux MFS transporter permease subunit [Pengzhenrongella frigida]|uniref:DHA2 family efflux MFS transporter permease subunit n=1 Tax=Pengzhenrongella frigida TaxID=1259133 RepID=A0A4Q5MZF4_9MICO|nr:DHA2 family efflux MFS transporter permease subunit [Cellulomonas sp. HLT2-17]RYV51109.1 DHA2 family efflux MFS transporter permease subunit [Cellulomonas sp. HLT2-17]
MSLVRYGAPAGRWVLLATVLGSGMAFIDGTVVNIALPSIGAEFAADAASLQWTVNGYALPLAAFILLGGSLGDRFGRRRVFVIGVTWFAVASLLCGLAPNVNALIVARALQGVGGALLVPGSLAILQSAFDPGDRSRAIGAWSGLGGIAGAAGPFLGGWLVGVASWRLVFLINLPIALAVVVVALRHVPESADPDASRRIDVAGSLTGALGLACVTYGFTAWPERGADALVLGTLAVGAAAMIGFVVVEARSSHPMLPLRIFASRVFSATNVVTFLVYGAIGGLFFFLVITLQVVVGFSPLAAGLAPLPVTALMLVLSARAGGLAQRIGPRVPMAVGPLICAGGAVLLAGIDAGSTYLTGVLPGIVVFGLGLSLTVAPLTVTALTSAADRHAGVASGVNNAVARAAGLMAVAVLPLAAGVGTSLIDPATLGPANRTSMLICAGLLVAGGLLALGTIPSSLAAARPAGEPGAADPAGPAGPAGA